MRGLKQFGHHFACNIAWAWPYFVDCDYKYCGNQKESLSALLRECAQ